VIPILFLASSGKRLHIFSILQSIFVSFLKKLFYGGNASNFKSPEKTANILQK
jgi:hypothetical protein